MKNEQRNNKKSGLKNLRCFPYCSTLGHVARGFCGNPITVRVSKLSSSSSSTTPPDGSSASGSGGGSGDELWAYGEFRRVFAAEERGERSAPGSEFGGRDVIRVGEVLTKHALAKRLEEGSTSSPFHEGRVDSFSARSQADVVFTFNERGRGWNYAWGASKHTMHAKHAFVVYVFRRIPASIGGPTASSSSTSSSTSIGATSTPTTPSPSHSHSHSLEDRFICLSVTKSPAFSLFCRKFQRGAEGSHADASTDHASCEGEAEAEGEGEEGASDEVDASHGPGGASTTTATASATATAAVVAPAHPQQQQQQQQQRQPHHNHTHLANSKAKKPHTASAPSSAASSPSQGPVPFATSPQPASSSSSSSSTSATPMEGASSVSTQPTKPALPHPTSMRLPFTAVEPASAAPMAPSVGSGSGSASARLNATA